MKCIHTSQNDRTVFPQSESDEMKRRIEIEEQHDLWNPFFVCKEGGGVPFHIDRTKLDLKDQPSNFISFCDEVDSILEKASSLKYVCFNASLNFFSFILCFIILFFSLIRWIYNGLFSPFIIILSITSTILLIHLKVLQLKVDAQINHMINEVENTCKKYNQQGSISYEIHVEGLVGSWWCNRSKKMYLLTDYSAQDFKEHEV